MGNDCEEAKKLGWTEVVDLKDIPKATRKFVKVKNVNIKKNKALQKEFAKSADFFLASANAIKKIPRMVGPILNKTGKFPKPVTSNGVESDAGECLRTIKFQAKFKQGAPMCVATAVAHCGLSVEEIEQNVSTAVNFFITLCKKGWQNIKTIHIKST